MIATNDFFMDIQKYYYAIDDNQYGPVSLSELKDLRLSKETLIWYDGLDTWCSAQSIPELNEILQYTTTPPPLPTKPKRSAIQTHEVPKHPINYHPNNNQSQASFWRMSRSQLRSFTLWSGFHLLALMLSYSGIDWFSYGHRTSEFWPIVSYEVCRLHSDPDETVIGELSFDVYEICEFTGLFSQYDWTEFGFYIGGYIFIWMVYKLSR